MARVLWTQKQDIGPHSRAGHAMAYDTARRRVVLFGGDTLAGTLFGDTWEWNGDSWTQIQDIGPAARAFHALAFDSVRNCTVLFGGSGADARLRDTWEWDGELWTQVADSGPASRSAHAMAFDVQRRRIVLFGGESDDGRLNDTWEWDGNEWVQTADSGPSPRVHPALAFDTIRNRLVLFGGAAQDAGLGDTWEWDGSAWTEEADFGPDPCVSAAMVFTGTRAALFGGSASLANTQPSPALFGRSWEWNGRHWTARQDMGPGPRMSHAMAFDASRSRVVLFGGVAVPKVGAVPADVRGDTWEQFESEGGAPTPPPPPQPAAVSIVSVEVNPDPASAGQEVTITVTLGAPAPTDIEVELLIDGQLFSVFQIPQQMAGGVDLLAIPPGQPAGVVTLTARAGNSEASVQLIILPVEPVHILELLASPNPVNPGGILTLTVNLAAPGTGAVPIAVLLVADEVPIGVIPIDFGATSGQVDLLIPEGTPSGTVVFRAESGGSQAEVAVQIVAA